MVYVYAQANRLISTTLGSVTSLYNYNGDGARLRQVVGGTPTIYTQDMAAPLPVVLQAQTGSATTQYLYSLGTRPIGQYTGVWEYLLPDALGSVRQIADASGSVTLAESYEPYGTVLTSTGTASSIFGYAGEQFDTTGLIYLRARYMNPTLGIFLARDPWNGDVLRPGSMNGWNYVDGNPVDSTDPTGANPQLSGIGEAYQYSCNCGWVDWTHFQVGVAANVIESFNKGAGQYPISVMENPSGESGGVAAIYSVEYSLGRNSYLALASALGVYESIETHFERYQGGEEFPIRGVADILYHHSSFSEEDLTSDLLGFYGAVWEKRDGVSPDDVKLKVQELCKVVGLHDDPATRLQKQLDIYWRYIMPYSPNTWGFRGLGGFQDVFEWGKPRLADIDSGWCSTYCPGSDRSFPSQFQEFVPIHGGTWGWISGHAELHTLGIDWYHEFTASELNR